MDGTKGKREVVPFVFLIEQNLTSDCGQYEENIHFYDVRGTHSVDSEDWSLLGCDTDYFGTNLQQLWKKNTFSIFAIDN